MKRLMLITLTGVLCAAAFTVARAQEPNPNLKTTKNVKVFLPDLVVSNVAIGDGAGGIAQSVRVTVTNTCEAAAASSYVLATFKDQAGKALYYAGNTVKALKGGESQEQVFDVSGKKMPAGTNVSVEVDPYRKLKEDVEGNNYRKLNPNMAPFPDGPTHCKAKG
ncbi:MAG TPA: CARDB domain-containing protein [Pyrinomonadaceae bacterium]|nr:CARDB domain-containing protein [Pyrinomonadaceae bacterium]